MNKKKQKKNRKIVIDTLVYVDNFFLLKMSFTLDKQFLHLRKFID